MSRSGFAIGLVMLAGCGARPPASAPAAPGEPAAVEALPSPAASAAKSRPQFGTWGFDTGGMDRTVAAGVDFVRYANGHWMDATPIPADKPLYATFLVLDDISIDRTHQILEAASGPPGSDAQKIGDYYRTYIDEAAIEARGVAPIKPWLDDIAKIADARGVMLQLALASRRQVRTPLTVYIAQDDRAPEEHIANLVQGGLGLPDRDTYDTGNAQFAKVRDGYRAYLAKMLTLIGAANAEQRAAAVYALEEKIAKTHWTRVQNRDPQRTYNKLSIAELARLAPAVDWKPWLAAVGLAGQTHLDVNEPSAITGTAQLIARQPVAVWRDYLALQLLRATSSYLPKRFSDARFEMFGKVLNGSEQDEERWKRGVRETTVALGEAIGKLYVAKYFTPETKARAEALVANLTTSMRQRLDRLTWMSAETKAKAKAKLAAYRTKIGYPDKWRDYTALTITAGDAVGNAQRAAEFEFERELAKLGRPLDRDEWEIPPMTVDAYYSSTRNEIVFPAGILQPPFFDPAADDAVNYGGIGAVIGHEISHGFDDQGAQYDASGTLANWWAPQDAEKFKAASQNLVAQYSAYCPVHAADGKPAQCVKGELTLGENIADVAGLTIAYGAYQISLGGKPAPVIDGFTGAQRFFLGFAQVWRSKYRDEYLANRLVTDPHSPMALRPLAVRNLDAWYDAFHVHPGEAQYLAADARVQIW
jgi:putative endopeptidase